MGSVSYRGTSPVMLGLGRLEVIDSSRDISIDTDRELACQVGVNDPEKEPLRQPCIGLYADPQAGERGGKSTS
jgi:hypothetical protein